MSSAFGRFQDSSSNLEHGLETSVPKRDNSEDIQTEGTALFSSHVEGNLLPVKDYESLNYDRCHNYPYNVMIGKLNQEKWFTQKLEIIRWFVTFLIGFLTALVALFIDAIVKQLFKVKYDTVENNILYCSEHGCLVLSLLWLLLFNAGFVTIASILTAIEPVAAGSGIPEIKCYLNGVKVPHVVRLKTLLSKAVGVLFSVAGGLFVGKEGPMIHSGAIIGSGVPQFQSIAFRQLNLHYSFFRTDRDKRDFVSGGAAAGVAAAFGAPIGGVLFSLEEGSSFWNQKLTWRTFFCSMAATFSLNFFLSGINEHSWGNFYSPGLINFGVFKCESSSVGECHLWSAVDLLVFLVMGFVGGLLGALFNVLNERLTVYRMRHIHRRHKVIRILEAVLIALVTTTVAFVAAMTLGDCRKIASNSNSTSEGVRTYFCPDGYYNDMATLFFNPQEIAIKQLFHQEGTFSLTTLGIFFICFFFLACWTYGASIPSGLFVPSLLCGAAFGRFVATLLVNVLGYPRIYSGTFALVGAAAFLGGVVRMTISLTVILIESTNEISYGLPIMLVLMVAKWSGDLFTEGLYDIHIKLRNVPLLEWEAPPKVELMRAKDIMSKELKYVYPHSRVQTIINILRTTAHHAYPVVTRDDFDVPASSGRVQRLEAVTSPSVTNSGTEANAEVTLSFHGIILRSDLVVLLKKGVFYKERDSADCQPEISYAEFTSFYPRYPDIYDIDSSQFSTDSVIDVTPYMNASPYTVLSNTPVSQVFNLFRSMGLRHLPVLDALGKMKGLITRHNLTHEYLEEKLEDLVLNSSA